MPIKPEEEVKQYIHEEQKRLNNPQAGLVNAETDLPMEKTSYIFDPNLDPQLNWAGKNEDQNFLVDTVSLHVHERIDPLTIIEAVRTKNYREQQRMFHYFETKENHPAYREAIKFYKHSQGWSNRLIAGDSLLVMNSLLEKEGMMGKIQMIYLDPPYGIKYSSNFQPFVNKRDVKDGKDEDLTQEPEMIKAFRDTWELGIHSYLTYLRNRLLLVRDLLAETGSIFVQISDENLHHVKEIMDEIFGPKNFVSIIAYVTTSSQTRSLLPTVADFVIWYCKDKSKIKYKQLYIKKEIGGEGSSKYNKVLLPDGSRISLNDAMEKYSGNLPDGSRLYRIDTLTSQSGGSNSAFPVEFRGDIVRPRTGFWKTNAEGMRSLVQKGRIEREGTSIGYIRYIDDFPAFPLGNVWIDYASVQSRADPKVYVVQTATKVVQRCMLMTTDPGDIVFDPTCGSGTTAFVAEQWGRRWITCDTSRVAITLAKQRIMTALFDYYQLASPTQGVISGFRYRTVPHVTLKSIAQNEPPAQEVLYDQPNIDKTKKRITGPFTIEAVPSPYVKSFDDVPNESEANQTISRSGETLRQGMWRSEIVKTGIRGKGNQNIEFTRVETLSGAKWLHADAETKEKEPKRVVLSFGPDYAPLEQKQVELALEEASHLFPKPKIVVFAAFQFDPEASKDIDEANLPGVTLLKVQMNADLHTDDLKKKRSGNESFWLIGQPDVETCTMDGGKIVVTVKGFDYYNTRSGQLESGGPGNIAMWMLDPDYDYRSLYPRQVFFPIADDDEGWNRLSNTLKTEIDPELIKHYSGTVSLPFKPGNAVAIKIIDDRGIESLKIIRM
jgi:adenine-specific DNA-methyltransferase